MPMMPKRVKFRKSQRGKMKGNATRGNYVSFGEFGLQSLESAWIPAKTLEAARVAVSHAIGRSGRLFRRIYPQKSVSAKPLEVRMGSGKGEPEFWCAVVKPGTILFEISGVDEAVAKRALARVAHKMPVRTRFVSKRHAVA
jgi:large subunit ribosomal protein L16